MENHLIFDAKMQRTYIAKKTMFLWLEKLTVDCQDWILPCVKLYESLTTSFYSVSLIACVYLYVGFFAEVLSIDCCGRGQWRLWFLLRMQFSEKMTPVTP